jgi:hypothetical protein
LVGVFGPISASFLEGRILRENLLSCVQYTIVSVFYSLEGKVTTPVNLFSKDFENGRGHNILSADFFLSPAKMSPRIQPPQFGHIVHAQKIRKNAQSNQFDHISNILQDPVKKIRVDMTSRTWSTQVAT